MRKKSLLLAFLLTLTAVVPVRTSAAETVMESEIALIEVTVPQTGRIILNPYGLPVEIGGGTTTEQIASETLTITNNGDTPVIVSASAAGHISEQSSMSFVTAPPAADAGEKEIFVYAEFQPQGGRWTDGYSEGDNQILISESASQTKEVLTLDAAAEGSFRLFGATTVSPAEAWSGTDELSVFFAFTFVPVIEPAQDPVSEEQSNAGEDPTAGETPVAGEVSADGETPVAGKDHAEGETPVAEETPADGETPAAGETSAAGESPAPEESPEPAETPELAGEQTGGEAMGQGTGVSTGEESVDTNEQSNPN